MRRASVERGALARSFGCPRSDLPGDKPFYKRAMFYRMPGKPPLPLFTGCGVIDLIWVQLLRHEQLSTLCF